MVESRKEAEENNSSSRSNGSQGGDEDSSVDEAEVERIFQQRKLEKQAQDELLIMSKQEKLTVEQVRE